LASLRCSRLVGSQKNQSAQKGWPMYTPPQGQHAIEKQVRQIWLNKLIG
jgi:hypothetical protein